MTIFLFFVFLVALSSIAIYKTIERKKIASNFAVNGDVYFHPGHTWVSFRPSGLANIGFDRFARKLIGHFDEMIVPSEGRRIKKGQTIFSVIKDGKTLNLVSPIDCVMSNMNMSIDDNKEYDSDSVLFVKPVKFDFSNMKRLSEFDEWYNKECDRLRNLFSDTELGLVMTDGGEISDNLIDKLDKNTLRKIEKEFLLV